MRITGVETIPLMVPLGRTFRGSKYQMSERATLVVRLHTDEGVVGETYNGDEVHTQIEIARIVREELLPLIKGRDPLLVDALWESMLPVTFDILRDRRLALMAMASVDSALWDIVGKIAGLPLHRLWGGQLAGHQALQPFDGHLALLVVDRQHRCELWRHLLLWSLTTDPAYARVGPVGTNGAIREELPLELDDRWSARERASALLLSALAGEPWSPGRPEIDRSSPEAIIHDTDWMPFMATVMGLMLILAAVSTLATTGWQRLRR
jgi:hypothetical protein